MTRSPSTHRKIVLALFQVFGSLEARAYIDVIEEASLRNKLARELFELEERGTTRADILRDWQVGFLTRDPESGMFNVNVGGRLLALRDGAPWRSDGDMVSVVVEGESCRLV